MEHDASTTFTASSPNATVLPTSALGSIEYMSRKNSPIQSDDFSNYLISEKNNTEMRSSPELHTSNSDASTSFPASSPNATVLRTSASGSNSLLDRCLELDASSKHTSENSLQDFFTNSGNTLNTMISKLTNEFYSSQRKHIFFKKNQKMECAEFVNNNMNLNELIKKTIFVIPNTNSIYFDYPLFKCYGTMDNYKSVVNFLLYEINFIIIKYGTFNIHVNLLSFTMSAAERYTQAIQMFCNECFKNVEIKYIDSMDTMYIYNTPNMISAISTALIRFTNESIKDKMVYYSKEESVAILEKLIVST